MDSNKLLTAGAALAGLLGLGVGIKIALDAKDELDAANELNAAMKAQRRREADRLRLEIELEERLYERSSAAEDLNRRMADSANQEQNTIFGKYTRI